MPVQWQTLGETLASGQTGTPLRSFLCLFVHFCLFLPLASCILFFILCVGLKALHCCSNMDCFLLAWIKCPHCLAPMAQATNARTHKACLVCCEVCCCMTSVCFWKEQFQLCTKLNYKAALVIGCQQYYSNCQKGVYIVLEKRSKRTKVYPSIVLLRPELSSWLQQVAHGNEDTFREMLRIRRSVAASFSQTHFNTTIIDAATAPVTTGQLSFSLCCHTFAKHNLSWCNPDMHTSIVKAANVPVTTGQPPLCCHLLAKYNRSHDANMHCSVQ